MKWFLYGRRWIVLYLLILLCGIIPSFILKYFGYTFRYFEIYLIIFIIVVGTLGMMVPASGGIGAFHLALKFGIMALFLSLGKNPEEGSEVGLSYAFISHTMQLVIMIVLGIISIPMLARSRNRMGKG